MVSKTPIFYTDSNNIDNVTLTNRLKTLEESINSFMAFNSETKIAERPIISCNDNTLTVDSAITEVSHTTVGKKVNSGGPKLAEVYEPLWSNVVAKGNKIATPRQGLHENVQAEKTKTWRKQLNLLHGTAFCNNGVEGTLSADIDLVAYGVAKHVTSIRFSKFLEEKGSHVCDCKLLTTFEGARTLSFKITIKPHHFEKAKDPSIRPYRVGVRLFKYSNANNRNKIISGKSVRFARDLPVSSLV